MPEQIYANLVSLARNRKISLRKRKIFRNGYIYGGLVQVDHVFIGSHFFDGQCHSRRLTFVPGIYATSLHQIIVSRIV